jgi:nucleoside-diphosphate-sugar epimerase
MTRQAREPRHPSLPFPLQGTSLKPDSRAKPRVLITGATGFVGSHVAERLASQGTPLRALVRTPAKAEFLRSLDADLVEGALDRPESLARAVDGVDVIVHIAAATHAKSAADFHRINEQGTRDLIRAAQRADSRPRRFVYLSSLAAAGPSPDGRPIGPRDEPRPLTAYGRSKLAGEVAALEASAEWQVAILRAPAVYGPRDPELFRFFRLAAWGIMPVPAGPARRLQLVNVADLADAIVLAALDSQAVGLFHIAEPTPYEWTEVTRLMAGALGKRARTFPVPRLVLAAAATLSEGASRLAGRSSVFNREKVLELLAPAWLCETETARAAFGFEAKVALPEGLRQTAQWYRNNGWL